MESVGDCVKDLFQFPEPKHTSLVKAVMHQSVEKNQGMSRNHSVVLPFFFFFFFLVHSGSPQIVRAYHGDFL